MFRIRSFINEFKKEYKLHIINTSYRGKGKNTNYYKIDENYSTKLDEKTRIRENPLFRSFILPFFYIGWIIACFIKGSKIIESEKIDIILVSHGPPHVLILGYLLKLKNRNCKLITDYRDSWTDNPYRTYPTRIIRRVIKNIERDILDKSSLIVVVSEVERKRFLINYENIENKITIIRNGFFDCKQTLSESEDYFKITHAGSFYKKKQPDIIFKAYKKFIQQEPEFDSKLFFIGKLSNKNIEKIKKMRLEKQVVTTGDIPYEESLAHIKNSDLLIFYEPTLAMTTKIYDYLSSGNPILSITNNTEVIKFVEKYSGFSMIINEYDVEKITEGIKHFYYEWKKQTSYEFKLKKEYFTKYSRHKIAKKLVEEIEERIK